MFADFQDIESCEDGGMIVITRRMGIETKSDLMISNCRNATELRRIQGEDRWSKRVRIVTADIRQRII